MSLRIKNNLWQVGGRGITHPSDAAVYLLTLDDRAVLIDSGTGQDRRQLTRNIAEALGPDGVLEYILLTHCHVDHAGGAPSLRDEFGCRIVVHELDAVYLEAGDNRVTGAALQGSTLKPFEVDVKLKGPETTLTIGSGTVKAIHCPGHSPGSVVYTTCIDDQLVLFGQDVHGPIRSDYLSDEDKYLDSLQRLLSLRADLLLEGHFGIIEPKEEVFEYIRDCIDLPLQPCRC